MPASRWIIRIYTVMEAGFTHCLLTELQVSIKLQPPHRDLPLLTAPLIVCWHTGWNSVHFYFVYLTVTQPSQSSLFHPQCHFFSITLYYANSSLHGYCSARHQCCHSSDWQLLNMCSRGCHLLQKHGSFQKHCSVYASLWDLNITRSHRPKFLPRGNWRH